MLLLLGLECALRGIHLVPGVLNLAFDFCNVSGSGLRPFKKLLALGGGTLLLLLGEPDLLAKKFDLPLGLLHLPVEFVNTLAPCKQEAIRLQATQSEFLVPRASSCEVSAVAFS